MSNKTMVMLFISQDLPRYAQQKVQIKSKKLSRSSATALSLDRTLKNITDQASCSQEKSMVFMEQRTQPSPSHSRKNVTKPLEQQILQPHSLGDWWRQVTQGYPVFFSGNRRFEETLNQYQQRHRKLFVSVGSCHLHIKQQHIKTTWKSLERCKITNLDMSWHFFRIQNPINNNFHCHEMELFPTHIFNDTSSMWQSYQLP